MVQLTLNILLKDSILDDKSIIKSYKRVSSFYDYTFGKVFKPGQQKLVSMMECTSKDKVLEIGIVDQVLKEEWFFNKERCSNG